MPAEPREVFAKLVSDEIRAVARTLTYLLMRTAKDLRRGWVLVTGNRTMYIIIFIISILRRNSGEARELRPNILLVFGIKNYFLIV